MNRSLAVGTALVVWSLGPVPDATAQQISVEIVGALPKNSLRTVLLTERTSGGWGGFRLGVRAGQLQVVGGGMRGKLSPDADNQPERAVGQVSLSGRFDVTAWLAGEAEYTARAYSSAAGRQRWDIGRTSVVAFRRLRQVAEVQGVLSYMPLVRVTGLGWPTSGVGSQIGIVLAPGGGSVTIAMEYRVEQYRFTERATLGSRTEQFEVLALGVGVRLERREGRWAFPGRR